jgi:hypothetical protein
MKTILATTYAVNPYKGSEDGMGWNFVLQIAKYNNVIAITRENNRQAIEEYMGQNPNDVYSNMTFLYYDLPYWMRCWKKGNRGAMFYYLLWQKGIVSFIKNQKIQYDIVHNVNFHNDWTPSFLWKLGKTFCVGPCRSSSFDSISVSGSIFKKILDQRPFDVDGKTIFLEVFIQLTSL